MMMKITAKALLFLLAIYSLTVAKHATAENAADPNSRPFSVTIADSTVIDNSQLINEEGSLLLNFEAKANYIHPISLEQLKGAKTLNDLMRAYPQAYIDQYQEVRLSFKGMICSSESEVLNEEQKKLIQTFTVADKFKLEVDFKSKGVLDHKLVDKRMDFEITVVPAREAYYKTGENAMNTYFKDEILKGAKSFDLLALTGIGIVFTIGENGKVIDPYLEDCSPYKQLSDFLIKTAENMPAWIPAMNVKGKKISQEFYLKISALDGC
jgi:hypothetical protein